MKSLRNYPQILVILLLGLLPACSQGGSSDDRRHCSYEGEVCVSLDITPRFEVSTPVDLKVTVTSAKDFPDLHLTLVFNSDIVIDGVDTWEDSLKNKTIDNGLAFWNFEIKAGQTLTFTRVLHFPAKQQGYFHVYLEVTNPGRIVTARDDFTIVLTKAGGLVFLDGTPIPIYTPHVTSAAYGPGTPAPTNITDPTNPWRKTYEPPTDFDSTSTPTTAQPYPPPFSPSPTPTAQSYP